MTDVTPLDAGRLPSEEEMNRLEELITSDRTPEDCMMIDEIDGLFAALICGPEAVMPSEWLPCVWRGDPPRFESFEEAQAILGTLTRWYNGVASLINAGDGYSPILLTATDQAGREVDLPHGWCAGFIEGIGLREAAWKRHAGKTLMGLLAPILALANPDPPPEISEVLDRPGAREEAIDMIPDCVYRLRAYWTEKGPDRGRGAAMETKAKKGARSRTGLKPSAKKSPRPKTIKAASLTKRRPKKPR